MREQDEALFRRIDDDLLDLIELLRARWPNFNSVGAIDKIIHHLIEALRASGKAGDLCDKGHLS